MSNSIQYQPWLNAVLTIAKHYRMEPSEERLRLQLDWNPNQTVDEVLGTVCRQIGLSLRKSSFSEDVLNPWRLPVIIEMQDGQVGVLDKVDAEGNASIQFSGDQGLAQVLTIDLLKQNTANVYILRPKNPLPMSVSMNT